MPAVRATKGFSNEDIPDLGGRCALVTGANSGIGFQVALQLAGHGATTVLGCRDLAKAQEAQDLITSLVPGAFVEIIELDLADLDSVARAADRFEARQDRLDLLVNNAGVMATPPRLSAQGYELQFATNHLGHFALTGRLLGLLLATASSRVVTVSSLAHWVGRLGPDPAHPPRYHRVGAYAGSKLANLLFAFELERRLRAAGATTLSVAAHPGWTRSNLAASGPGLGAPIARRLGTLAGRHLGQAAWRGALPVLAAAAAADIGGGAFVGPGGPLQVFGPPAQATCRRSARHGREAARLWELSESLTKVTYRFG